MHTFRQDSEHDEVLTSHWPPPTISVKGPRKVRISDRGRSSIRAVQLLLASVAVIGSVLTINEGNRVDVLRTSGVEVTGKIVDRKVSKGESDTYSLTYQYQVDGVDYVISEGVPLERYTQKEIGDPVTVTYLAESPRNGVVGKVTEQEVKRQQAVCGLVIAFICSVLVGVLLVLRNNIRYQIAILTHWDAHTMRVTKVQVAGSNASSQESRSAAFTIDSEQEVRTAKFTIEPEQPIFKSRSFEFSELESSRNCKVGDYITVLVSPLALSAMPLSHITHATLASSEMANTHESHLSEFRE